MILVVTGIRGAKIEPIDLLKHAFRVDQILLNNRVFVQPITQQITPPKFNIAPEKRWLEDYFPIGMVTFQGLC